MTDSFRTVHVSHLGGSEIGCRLTEPYDPQLPTVALVTSFATSSELFRPQFADRMLTRIANLLAIEPYGHGATRSRWEQFTYWDSAVAALQVLDALGISTAFLLGTSQGGRICARMAMLEPQVVKGMIVLGTSMDFESRRSQDLGCWNGIERNTPTVDMLGRAGGDDWKVPDALCDGILAAGLGSAVTPSDRSFWRSTMQRNYAGDDGRKRLRTCAINLRDRDGLHARLDGVRCPVLWMHGTDDKVYSIPNAEEEIKMFVSSPNAELHVIHGGQHFLSASNPREVNTAAAALIEALR